MMTISRRSSLLVPIGALIVIVLIAGTAILVSYARSGAGILTSNPGGYSLFWQAGMAVGSAFYFQIPFDNVSSDKTIIMRPVTFSNGLPAHLQIKREVLRLGPHMNMPYDTSPEVNTIHPLDGYQLEASRGAVIILSLVADMPGIYTIGPVTIHADIPVLFTAIPIENTYSIYGAMCVQVDQEQCEQYIHNFKP